MFGQRRGSGTWRGRGLGLGWLFAFGLGYVLRDLQEPDSQVRRLVDAIKDRLDEAKGECCCGKKDEHSGDDDAPEEETD